MSDIPDWLVELAAQRDDDDEETPPVSEAVETSADEIEEEWDFLRASPADVEVSDTDDWKPFAAAGVASSPAEEENEGEVIEVLRSQVEAGDVAPEAPDIAPRRAVGFQIAGLLPWQQAVLAILLLLDIAVIGFLFLVMLGKMSIG